MLIGLQIVAEPHTQLTSIVSLAFFVSVSGCFAYTRSPDSRTGSLYGHAELQTVRSCSVPRSRRRKSVEPGSVTMTRLTLLDTNELFAEVRFPLPLLMYDCEMRTMTWRRGHHVAHCAVVVKRKHELCTRSDLVEKPLASSSHRGCKCRSSVVLTKRRNRTPSRATRVFVSDACRVHLCQNMVLTACSRRCRRRRGERGTVRLGNAAGSTIVRFMDVSFSIVMPAATMLFVLAPLCNWAELVGNSKGAEQIEPVLREALDGDAVSVRGPFLCLLSCRKRSWVPLRL